MASASSIRPRNYSYNVFSSFHGPDVRKTLLSHMREQFNRNGITMFDDQKIERSATIAPSLIVGIRESRISIVILSTQYASSSWCLDELVEILECKNAMGQIVMTIFYGVDPSDVRKQIGEFGIAFDETCERNMDEKRQKWSKALNEVGNIAGEDFLRWDNEANMIKKIARDVLDKLNVTPSRDFDDMVGLEAHLREMESLLDLGNAEVKIVAISGPVGIGKTTIARALHGLLSNRFQLSCFVDNLRENYHCGFDEYGLKLHLQEQFLSKVLNQIGMRICHLGAIKENLSDQRVLIILDDVNHMRQLMALANETTWFGPGSRIVVTTENKELLQQHGINNTYHVRFPSYEQALQILCKYAFNQTSPRHGFQKLVERVTELCGKLPLGLSVVGSSLRGKKEDEWEHVVRRLETILDRDIEDVLRVGYESLDENEQTLFLHIAVFFNNRNGDLVKTMFVDSDLDVKYGLKILENRSLIEIKICSYGDIYIVMHRLLQQVGKKAIQKQEPCKRQILIDAPDICDVLEYANGTRVLSGISFDISNIDEVSINEKAFNRLPNLRFLKVYKSKDDGTFFMHIPEEMEFPRRLRLLHWEAYPGKSLPPTFNPKYLVELDMQQSLLEKLWEGTQPFANLKKMNLSNSYHLKELPELSNATNLEELKLEYCESLVEIPSSFSHLHKLNELWMTGCRNLQMIPAHMNLASLEWVTMNGCSRLKYIPLMSTNINTLCTRGVSGISFDISNIDEVSINKKAFNRMPNLQFLKVYKSKDDGTFIMHIPEEMEFPRRLRLLDWEAYPCKSLPRTFNPKYLVELDMQQSLLEKLWEGTQPLTNLKKINLSYSYHLKELPDLSNATNLEELNMRYCVSLVEIPSSFSHLHKLNNLWMTGCINLQAIPAHMNLASLEWVTMNGCSRLKNIPLMSTNIITLNMEEIGDVIVHPSIRLCSRLNYVHLGNTGKLKGLTHLPNSVTCLDLSNSDIERIPNCIKALHQLEILTLYRCRRLTTLPELPPSLKSLEASDCESMEIVFSPFNTSDARLDFTNCFKLSQQARRAIIQHSSFCAKIYYPKPWIFEISGTALLPGREVPAEFDHRAMGNTLTVVLDGNRSYSRFVFCVVISANQQTTIHDPLPSLYCRCIGQSNLDPFDIVLTSCIDLRTKHLFTFHSGSWLHIDPSEVSRERMLEINSEPDDVKESYRPEVSKEMIFEFSSDFDAFDIVECGAKILTQEESIEGIYESESEQVFGDNIELEPSEEAIVDDTEYNEATNIDGKIHTGCWSWLFICFDHLVSGRR